MAMMQVVLLGTVIIGAEAYHYNLGNITQSNGNHFYNVGNESYHLGNVTTGLCTACRAKRRQAECAYGLEGAGDGVGDFAEGAVRAELRVLAHLGQRGDGATRLQEIPRKLPAESRRCEV